MKPTISSPKKAAQDNAAENQAAPVIKFAPKPKKKPSPTKKSLSFGRDAS